MLNLLSLILCAIRNLALSFIASIVLAFNAVIEALGTLIAGLLSVLPEFPSSPSLPSPLSTVLGWIAWVFPVSTMLAILAWAAVAFLVWQGVALALRWARAL